MALTATLSTYELARVAAACYEGKRVRVSLANVGATGFTAESAVASWDSVKVSGSGYADFTDVVETGAYDATDTRYEMGGTAGANTYVTATFTPTGGSLTYDTIYVVIGTSDGLGGWTEQTRVHSILVESPAVTLAPDVPVTYRIQLFVGT
jgi:hypothetical protein